MRNITTKREVRLTDEQRQRLETLTRNGSASAKKIQHARVLLLSDIEHPATGRRGSALKIKVSGWEFRGQHVRGHWGSHLHISHLAGRLGARARCRVVLRRSGLAIRTWREAKPDADPWQSIRVPLPSAGTGGTLEA
jgi:hypothetical protein